MGPQLSPVTFLLVEDDDDHAKIVERSLQRERIDNNVHRLADGIEALKFLRHEGQYADSKLPDVILLDLKLPKMSGHEVLAEIKADQNLRGIPVVILTTSNAEADRYRAYDLHANSYLVKPLDIHCFRQMVQGLSLYWGVFNMPILPREGVN